MWRRKTEAIKSRDITKTGTGPLKGTKIQLVKNENTFKRKKYSSYTLTPGESSV